VQCSLDIPGHPLNIIVQEHIKIFPDVADLGEGFVPESLQCGVGVCGFLPIPKKTLVFLNLCPLFTYA
jgi:hypothetical protein